MALTYASVISDAKQIAKCPGFDPQAGDFLNELLSTLAQTYDLPESQQLMQLPIGPNGGTAPSLSQPFQWYILNIPVGTAYLRTKEVFYNVQGTIFFLNELNKAQYDQLFQGAGISNYPYWYCPDQTQQPPWMAFYPPPNINLTLNIRVQYQPADVANPNTSTAVPWFRNRRYLVTRLAADLMQITGDQRATAFAADAAQQLDRYLMKIDDQDNNATRIKLDPLMFRAIQKLPPTKTTGF